jgi:hypothetical protein
MHKCLEAKLGICLYAYLYPKLAKMTCLSHLLNKIREEGRTGSAWKWGLWGWGMVTQTMHIHVSKCKNDERRERERKKKSFIKLLAVLTTHPTVHFELGNLYAQIYQSLSVEERGGGERTWPREGALGKPPESLCFAWQNYALFCLLGEGSISLGVLFKD